MEFNEIKIAAFSFKARQNRLLIYPVTDKNSRYRLGDDVIYGRDLSENGIEAKFGGNYRAVVIELRKE